jgi:hypothetical protein
MRRSGLQDTAHPGVCGPPGQQGPGPQQRLGAAAALESQQLCRAGRQARAAARAASSEAEVHAAWAAAGLAPRLPGRHRPPGGWLEVEWGAN